MKNAAMNSTRTERTCDQLPLTWVTGPQETFTGMSHAAAQLHQNSRSCIAQHFRKPGDGSAGHCGLRKSSRRVPNLDLRSLEKRSVLIFARHMKRARKSEIVYKIPSNLTKFV